MLEMFRSTATHDIALGADALRYVMTHGHTISVPDQALRFAEKVAILSVQRREDESPTVLAAVNIALDLIASTLRRREQLDREGSRNSLPPVTPAQDLPGGHPVRTIRPVPSMPPAGAAAVMTF